MEAPFTLWTRTVKDSIRILADMDGWLYCGYRIGAGGLTREWTAIGSCGFGVVSIMGGSPHYIRRRDA